MLESTIKDELQKDANGVDDVSAAFRTNRELTVLVHGGERRILLDKLANSSIICRRPNLAIPMDDCVTKLSVRLDSLPLDRFNRELYALHLRDVGARLIGALPVKVFHVNGTWP